MIKPIVRLYKNAYSGLTRRMWLLGTVMLINRIGTMVLAFMTLYCSHLGFTIQQGGAVVAIYGIGSVAGAFIGGKISDKFGFYYTQFSALFLGGILFIVLGLMSGYGSICICTFFLSMANESFRPANATAIAHYSSPENRTQSFSLIRLAINLGFTAGTAIGGFLASFNYHLLFWVDGLTSISAAIMLVIVLPKVTLAQQRSLPVVRTGIEPGRSPYKDKRFLSFLIFQVLFATCFFQLFTTVPIFFKEYLHLDEFRIGAVMACNGILIAIIEMILVYKLEGRKPYLTLMTYGSILMACSFLVLNLSFTNGLLIALASIIILTVAEMISMPFMNSYYISRSSQSSRGQYAALYTMSWSVAQVIGSSAGSAIAYLLGFFNLWLIVCTFCLVAAGGYFWLQKKG